MCLVLGSPLCVCLVLEPLVFRLPYEWLAIALLFVGMIAGFVLPFVLLPHRPSEEFAIDGHGVRFKRRCALAFEELVSFDSSVYSYGVHGRQYLVLRTTRWFSMSSLVICPARGERARHARLCQHLMGLARLREHAGLPGPVWRPFWGSQGAKLMGVGGIGLIMLVVVAAFVLDPGHAFLAFAPAGMGAPVFIGMIRGKRPFA